MTFLFKSAVRYKKSKGFQLKEVVLPPDDLSRIAEAEESRASAAQAETDLGHRSS